MVLASAVARDCQTHVWRCLEGQVVPSWESSSGPWLCHPCALLLPLSPWTIFVLVFYSTSLYLTLLLLVYICICVYRYIHRYISIYTHTYTWFISFMLCSLLFYVHISFICFSPNRNLSLFQIKMILFCTITNTLQWLS